VLGGWLCQEDRERTWNTYGLMSLTVQVSPTRFRVADVVLMDRNKPIDQIPTIAPVAVFEVLSPEDCAINLLRKLADYEQMGIPFIRVRVYHSNGLALEQSLSASSCPCRSPFANRRVAATLGAVLDSVLWSFVGVDRQVTCRAAL
jgi:hypothetical protein